MPGSSERRWLTVTGLIPRAHVIETSEGNGGKYDDVEENRKTWRDKQGGEKGNRYKLQYKQSEELQRSITWHQLKLLPQLWRLKAAPMGPHHSTLNPSASHSTPLTAFHFPFSARGPTPKWTSGLGCWCNRRNTPRQTTRAFSEQDQSGDPKSVNKHLFCSPWWRKGSRGQRLPTPAASEWKDSRWMGGVESQESIRKDTFTVTPPQIRVKYCTFSSLHSFQHH